MADSIIAAAVRVHRALGPGFVEQIYENALAAELESREHAVARQVTCDVPHDGRLVGQHRADVLFDDEVVVELKSVDAPSAVHTAQLPSTLKAAGKRVGLLLNFNQETLTKGIKRVINWRPLRVVCLVFLLCLSVPLGGKHRTSHGQA